MGLSYALEDVSCISGLYTLEANSGEIADILKISKSIKLLVKMEIGVFHLIEKNHTDFLANPIIPHQYREIQGQGGR